MPSEPTTGNSRRRHGAPPTGYSRIPSSFRQQDECDDRQACQRAYHQRQNQKYLILTLLQLRQRCNSGVFHQVPLVVWLLSLISLGVTP